MAGPHYDADVLKMIQSFTYPPVHGIAAVTVMFTIEELNHRIIGVQGGCALCICDRFNQGGMYPMGCDTDIQLPGDKLAH